eukprot:scaffold63821_cov41-Tisochrysis_lutea.AAC.1
MHSVHVATLTSPVKIFGRQRCWAPSLRQRHLRAVCLHTAEALEEGTVGSAQPQQTRWRAQGEPQAAPMAAPSVACARADLEARASARAVPPAPRNRQDRPQTPSRPLLL